MEDLELMETITVPWQQLSTEALQALIEEFVTRDGTDYGEQESNLESRVQQVQRRLERGEALVLFSQESGQCNIVSKERLNFG